MPSSVPKSTKKKQRFNLSRWLIDLTPSFFDSALEKVGIKQFKWLILLLLIFSIPLIITPLEVWQQGAIAVFLVLLSQLVLGAEEEESSRKVSDYYHLFMVWLSLVTTMRYLYYRLSYTLNFDGWINGIA
ncbi:MAG: cellulose synthase, partial [Cyanobacteria bacterium J06635_10]